MAKCKSCGAEIIWIKTVNGKNIPCDAEKRAYKYKLGAKERIVTPNGEVLSCELDPQNGTDVEWGRISHFATCPNSDKHRRGK